MKHHLTKILGTLLLLFPVLLSAQQMEYSGVVTGASDGLTLPGVNILNQTDETVAFTDLDGNFSIMATPGDTLAFSYIGYATQKVTLTNSSQLTIVLEDDNQLLEEVVVVGYGSQKTRDLTSAISTVESEDILKTPNSQPMQALQGRIPGVQIVSSGTPGTGPTVRIRGVGSFPGSGSEGPLYVVDGMFFNNLDFLSPNDIQSISVLKDASAAAIYGVRAANGVVIVETKSGRPNQKAQIEYDAYYGVQVAQNVLKMANAEQFTQMALESGSEADASFILAAMQRYGRSRVNPNVPDVNTDWYDEILREAPQQNHSLTISGGGSGATYSVSGSYFNQDGILDMENGFERFNLRSRVDYQANNWLKVGGNVIMSNSTRQAPEQGAWFRAYFAVPIMPVFDQSNTDASPLPLANAQDLGYRGSQNPLSATEFSNNRIQSRNVTTNFYAEASLIPKKLVFRSAYFHNFISNNSRNVDLPFFVGNDFQRVDASISKATQTISNQIWDNTLTFTESFGNHNLQILGGTSFRDESFQFLGARGLNFPVGQETTWYIDQAENIPVDGVNDGGSRNYGLSYFSRVAYNYKHKYLLYGTFRADGTSKYQEKWGYFPTFGAGWVLSEEDFFDVKGVDYLKLRASWGALGNDAIPASDGANSTRIAETAINDILTPGTVTTVAFSSLSWERVEEFNMGLSTLLFDERLNVELDYFSRDTRNAVLPVEIPSVGGSIRRNVGVIRNSGVELSAGWQQTLDNGLTLSVGGNVATLNNEVRDIFGQTHIDGGSAEFRQRSIVGEPVAAFFGREVIGVYQNQAEIDADPVAIENNLEPGDLKYRDQNGDGLINDDDRVILGSYLPSLTYGANVNLGYKNFDFSVAILGQAGNSILNRKRGEVIFTNDTNIDADLAINRWHGEGTSNEYPSSKGIRKGWNQRLSDYFIEDGDFFRIQNVQLGYTIQGDKVAMAGFPNIRVYFTADRPLTLFNYNGFNPEVANGIDRQTYPIPAVYTFGLNAKF
ncbi:MAG: TonB-dependent receptor [Saprospiraceae bacterium]